jgi:hypothetical protein
LLGDLGNKSVSWNEQYGVPKLIINYGGYLPEPSDAAPVEIAKNFTWKNQRLFNLSGEEVINLSAMLPGHHRLCQHCLQ